jgi:predicted 2-oxoglutarate/Fe(II)-dependent dioxygenase YbiX
MGEHTDNYHDTCAFGCVVYLNNNFEGGNLYYPRIKQSFEPVPGRLVVHASDEPHMVETVTKGTRYMLTCFVYQSPDAVAELIRDN